MTLTGELFLEKISVSPELCIGRFVSAIVLSGLRNIHSLMHCLEFHCLLILLQSCIEYLNIEIMNPAEYAD